MSKVALITGVTGQDGAYIRIYTKKYHPIKSEKAIPNQQCKIYQ
jgi:GDP-D-mannose dehydratase